MSFLPRMLPLESIKKTLETMRGHQATVTQKQTVLNEEISRIEADKTRHPGYIKEKVDEARAKASPAIFETLGLINKEADRLAKASKFWMDKKFVLSQKPLTDAKDAGAESMERLAKMMEFSKMDNNQLQLAAEAAKMSERHGELYLISLENVNRDTKDPSWKQINLDDVELKDQAEALALFREARAIQSNISIQLKEVQGFKIAATDRLTAARAGI